MIVSLRDGKYPAVPTKNDALHNQLLREAVRRFGTLREHYVCDKASKAFFRANRIISCSLDKNGVLRTQLDLKEYASAKDCISEVRGKKYPKNDSMYSDCVGGKALSYVLANAMKCLKEQELQIADLQETESALRRENASLSTRPSLDKSTPATEVDDKVEILLSRFNERFSSKFLNFDSKIQALERNLSQKISSLTNLDASPKKKDRPTMSKKTKRKSTFLHCQSITNLDADLLQKKTLVVKVETPNRFFDAKDFIRNLKRKTNFSIHVYPLPLKHRGESFLAITVQTQKKNSALHIEDVRRLSTLKKVLGFSSPNVGQVRLISNDSDIGIVLSLSDALSEIEADHILYLYKKKSSFSGGRPFATKTAPVMTSGLSTDSTSTTMVDKSTPDPIVS